MALVREQHAAYGGFDAAADAFDAFGYGAAHDAAALFGAGYATNPEPAAAAGYSSVWAGGAGSVVAFDRAGSGDEEECEAWIDAVDDQGYGAAAPPPRPSVGFDATTGCFTLTESASSSSGGAGRAFGLLFPSTSSGSGGSPDRAVPARASQKRAYVVRATTAQLGTLFLWIAPGMSLTQNSVRLSYMQSAEPQAVNPNKKQCGAGRKTSKPKSAPAAPTKDPQSLAAKVTNFSGHQIYW